MSRQPLPFLFAVAVRDSVLRGFVDVHSPAAAAHLHAGHYLNPEFELASRQRMMSLAAQSRSAQSK